MEEEDKEVKFYYYSVDFQEMHIFSLQQAFGVGKGVAEKNLLLSHVVVPSLYLYIHVWYSSLVFSRLSSDVWKPFKNSLIFVYKMNIKVFVLKLN